MQEGYSLTLSLSASDRFIDDKLDVLEQEELPQVRQAGGQAGKHARRAAPCAAGGGRPTRMHAGTLSEGGAATVH